MLSTDGSSPASTKVGKQPAERSRRKCDFCRRKKVKCLPQNRDWPAGQKCGPCERGGQACGPSRRLNDEPPPQTLLSAVSAASCSDVSISTIADGPNAIPSAIQSRKATRDTEAVRAGTSKDIQRFGYTNTFPAKGANVLLNQWSNPSEDRNDASKRLTHLGYLRIALENIQGLQRSIGPHTITHETHETHQTESNLKVMAMGINKEYHSCVKELIQIAETKKPDVAKLIYLEVLEDVNHVQDQAGFSGLKAMIWQKLVHIYRHQRNLPAVERISKQLSENISWSGEFNWAQVINSLAQCFMETSTEISTLFDDIDMFIEPPLCATPNGLFPPLHRALRSGLDEVARVLCKSTEALNAVDMLRQNVVIAAAATGKVALLESVIYEMPRLLADRDVLARTALFHAAQQGDFDSFSYLVSAGANIHDSDSSGVRILDAAAASGSSIIVRCLLELGVPPNDGTLCLPSALHEAARSGHKDICIALLSHGAWANIRSPEDGHFKTPSQVALDHGFVAVAALLEEAEQHPKNDFFYQNSDESNNKQFRAARYKAASTSNATSMDMAPSWLSERSLTSTPGVLTPDTFRPSISEGSPPNYRNEWINVETCSPFGSILGTDRAISEPATEAEPLVECKYEVIDLTV